MAEQAGYDKNRCASRAKRRLMIRFGIQMPEKTGFTKDISETGLFIRTNSVLPPGRTIQVQIEFPKETFTLWAKVIWAKKVPPQLAHIMDCGMGVHFVEPPASWLKFCKEWKESQGLG
ncbi:MAG: PilZ domain-containing protein [Acidobacteria bacterium]|uniref:PilZ domain-containing protein n=1 Tax=Candidatus Polarisedimenticola svalbardensis TaxID=2886004 RepID=A0A8J6Y6L2_9BACT|nr:PilZ domain-containing protein [Candidatus Polarisedimenticola svalbardensis]